jgi:thiamine biosynthesis lipoprotein
MADRSKHSRRDFLKGRGAARTLTDKLQKWADMHVAPDRATSSDRTSLHVQASRRAMACDFEVQYHATDVDAADPVMEAFDLIESIEDQLTIYRSRSEVIDINRSAAEGPMRVEPHLFALLEHAERLFRETDGTFDITSTPLSRSWGFMRREGRLPTTDEIEVALAPVGFDKVVLDDSDGTIQFREPGVEINFNSIGKGYALDRAAAHLDEQKVTDYLWHGGRSSVLARGCNRTDPSQCWTLGLRDPFEPSRRLAEFYLRNRALGTAGGGTQFFEHDGKRYSHVIDPRTGWPARGVLTATALASTAAEADALATSFFVMGLESTAEYCAAHPEVSAVLVCPVPDDSEVQLHAWGLDAEDWNRLERSSDH